MTPRVLEFKARLQALCCAEWGVPPWEFEEACRAGKVRLPHVMRAVTAAMLRSPFSAEAMFRHLFPKVVAAQEREMTRKANLEAFKTIRDNALRRKARERDGEGQS